MTDRAVARRYAAALFDVASAAHRVEVIGRDLAAFADIVRGHDDLARVFASPAVSEHKKRAILEALLPRLGEVAREVQRLLQMLADRDRLNLIAGIAAAFAERLMDADRSVTADVTIAVPLDADRARALAEALGRATGRRVTMTQHLDPSIMGGVVARVGSVVFDGSVRRQLERMHERLVTGA